MKIKTLALTIPMLGLLAVPAFAQDTAPIANIGRLQGYVTNATYGQATIDTNDNIFSILFDKNTVFINQGQIVEAGSIATDDTIVVKYLQGISPNIYPPQVTARAILIQDEIHSNIFLGTLNIKNDSLVSDDNTIRIPLENEGISIYNAQGGRENLMLDELDGATVAVVYAAATFSIPAVPIQPVVFLVDPIEKEDTTKETDREEENRLELEEYQKELDQYKKEGQSTLTVQANQVSNFLDLLPFWAGGNLGARGTSTQHNHTPNTSSVQVTNPTALKDIEDIIDDNYFIGIEILVEEILEELA